MATKQTPHLIELKEVQSLPSLIEQTATQAQCVIRLLQLDGTAIVEKFGKGPQTSSTCQAEQRCAEIAAKWSASTGGQITCGCGHPMTVLPILFQGSPNGLVTICPSTPESQSSIACLASVITNCLSLARNAVELWSQYSDVLLAHRELYRETASTTDAESIPRVALKIVQKYLKADIALYLPKGLGGAGWEQPVISSQVDASEDWLDSLAKLIMISHDEDRCPLIILPENKGNYSQFAPFNLAGFISATVFCDSETMGRLVVCSRDDEANLSLADLSLLEILSNTIGLRIQDLRTRQHKQRFLERALHHITTPAHSVREIARQLTYNNLSDEARETSLADLTEQTERLVRLAQRARDFSALQKVSRPRTKTSLKHLVETAVRRIQPLAHIHQISVGATTPSVDIEVEADEEALHLAFQSILENAIKFSPSGGVVEVVLTTRQEDFTISVFDQGPGVPLAQRKHIFEELISIPRGEVRESTGMGLTIARLAAEEHGGSVQCLDNPRGKGACFSFTIPRSK